MTEPTLDVSPPSPEETQETPASPGATPSSLALEAPQPVAPVETTQAEGSVPLSDADRAKLDGMVSEYLDHVSSLDTHSQEFNAKLKDIARLGDDDIRASASVSNRLLEKPIAAMQNGGLTEASEVSH